MPVRAATDDDIPTLQAIEVAAGQRFRTVGMDDIAEHDPFDHDELAAFIDAGRAWTATTDDGTVVGYAAVDVVDGHGHLEQISVHPDHQGKGIARALMAAVDAWCPGDELTLTTFRDVPWNGPLYAHLGFTVIDDPGPELTHKVEEEAAMGLDPALRVVMSRRLLRRGDPAVDGDDGAGEVRPGS